MKDRFLRQFTVLPLAATDYGQQVLLLREQGTELVVKRTSGRNRETLFAVARRKPARPPSVV